MAQRKKVGLALGSGAARGLAHIGVIKTLEQNGIPIDFIAGTSVGALIGAHYALFKDIARTEFYTTKEQREMIGLHVLLEPTLAGGIVRGTKYEAMLDEIFRGKTFADTQIPFRANATDLISGEQVVFSEGRLSRAVRASSSVPGIFKPVVVGERALVDGGVSNPVPDDIAKSLGADVVISVNLDFFRNVTSLTPESVGIKTATLRSMDIMRHYLAHDSIRDSDFIVQPPLARYSSLQFFTGNFIEEVISIGESETERIIPELKKLLD